MARKKKEITITGKSMIESNKINVTFNDRRVYYYEFLDSKNIQSALRWLEGYCDKGFTLEATLDFDKYCEPLTGNALTRLKQLYSN